MNWFNILDIDASLPVKLDVKNDWTNDLLATKVLVTESVTPKYRVTILSLATYGRINLAMSERLTTWLIVLVINIILAVKPLIVSSCDNDLAADTILPVKSFIVKPWIKLLDMPMNLAEILPVNKLSVSILLIPAILAESWVTAKFCVNVLETEANLAAIIPMLGTWVRLLVDALAFSAMLVILKKLEMFLKMEYILFKALVAFNDWTNILVMSMFLFAISPMENGMVIRV